MSALDVALLAAHEREDHLALVDLYRRAAHEADTEDGKAFFLTHAHVFALEMGHPSAEDLRGALIAMGRETPLHPASAPKR